jgi:hypothetical protein
MNNKEEVKIADRIKLVHTDDKFTQLKPGDLAQSGTFLFLT